MELTLEKEVKTNGEVWYYYRENGFVEKCFNGKNAELKSIEYFEKCKQNHLAGIAKKEIVRTAKI